ncbi:MAG: hypothetical protein IJ899_18060 [Blautia sp.]|nr:hypothetical protein [Blautia sp.]
MFQLWGKICKGNRMLKETVYTEEGPDTRTHKVMKGLEEICYRLDLEKPIWLESNIQEFQRRARTRFTKDSFIESIGFDYLEIQVLEEDME